MLVKYREELTQPIDEAMEFLKRVEAQLDSISGGGSSSARLSLTGKIKIATSSDRRRSSSRSIVLLCFIFLPLARSLPSLLLLLRGGGRVFLYILELIEACRIGYGCFWIVGVVALDHLPL